jgi:hypothetical protein
MKILHDGKKSNSEIEISGRAIEFLGIGNALLDGQTFLSIAGETEPDKFYPNVLSNLRFEVETSSLPTNPISIAITQSELALTGGSQIMKKLGQSFVNFFSGVISHGQHFHLDHLGGGPDELLKPTDFHLIFACVSD